MTSTPSAPSTWTGGEHVLPAQVRCAHCGVVHTVQPFCPQCDTIQLLPADLDYFAILGLERRLMIDRDGLDRRYFELSRRLHPDRYQTGSPQTRIASLGNTAALNRAYRTLRDPVERGVYWLGLQGESLGANNNRVPPDLAALVFEVQEKLEALRDRDESTASRMDEVRGIRAELGARTDVLLQLLNENFSHWDAGGENRATLTTDLKRSLSAIKYLRTLIRDVDKALGSE